jgi:predicted NAD/FAD-binding protein
LEKVRVGEGTTACDVDVGFQVLNEATYPHLLRLYAELGVQVDSTDMSFAISLRDGRSWRHAADPSLYWRWLLRAPREVAAFVASKVRFHFDARRALAQRHHAPLGVWLRQQAYADVFVDGWLRPFCAAVWSLDGAAVDDMDLYALLEFLGNHGFLSWSTFKWFVPVGRANNEVAALRRALESTAHVSIRSGVDVRSLADCGQFDALILATDAPTARSILGSRAPAALARFEATRSTVYLHRDESLMPVDRALWSSWSVVQLQRNESKSAKSAASSAADAASLPHFGVSYWLHTLQAIPDKQLFVSLVPGASPPRRAPRADSVVWQRDMLHPQLSAGAYAGQRELGHLLAHGGIALGDNDDDRRRVFLAGAWLGTCFHESGVTSGALAARQALASVLPAGPQRLALAHSIPVWRTTPPTAAAALPAWFYRARTSHTSKVGAGYQFAYNMPEVCAVDLQHPPVYWWGGFSRADHWGAPTTPLLHAVVETVFHQIGFYCVGPVDCITTLRAFGQVNNPVSVYLLWRDDLRTQLDAVALEVTNYPWGERTLYAVDARQCVDADAGDAGAVAAAADDDQASSLRVRGRFRKTLHVSPFHEHPSLVNHWYDCSVNVVPTAPSLANTAAPFRRFTMRLRLCDVSPDGEDKVLHDALWALSEPEYRNARPVPVALQTSTRILRQAAALQNVVGRKLFAHVSQPYAPLSDVFTMAIALCVVLTLVVGARAVCTLIAAILVRLAVQRRLNDLVTVPPLRDSMLGAAVTMATYYLFA